ncbi:acetyltransferase (the isoleucine patch superfamily) [Acidothermus cellulolyticus 11B]|uniref:Acetyltransferase (The isoleucine patch superfamily) n=1 Tax=Acidothermus cellulolyticus (strain ATCC 43068 / DSM 8971 / 11B) TaxID=351607 RepID=A0LW97_ACIC1|nr:acetyltransferase [Acidothermus cellulolyticus]ABK53707.1 acetyltransferase (the isoleucine patch superfamily) [Acidothermus cellulolyticus 11B]
MTRPLVIAGSGGLAREAVQAVHAVNAERATWQLLGFLDDDATRHGTVIDGVPVLGPITADSIPETAQVLLATGRPSDFSSRYRLARRLSLPAERYATVVHPSACLAADTVLGAGCLVLAGVVATAAVRLGAHVAVMPRAVFTHDDVVADFATICAGATFGGSVQIDTGAYVGAGALVRENLRIGAWALVGMGSVVTVDVPAGEIWYGTPARRAGFTTPLGVELVRTG